MAKLLDYYADVDDFEEGPLTLVNRSHPVNVKRDRQNVTRTIAGQGQSVVQTSAFLDLPLDVFNIILDYVAKLELGGNLLVNLLVTCKGLYENIELKKANFQRAFSAGALPTRTYKEYKNSSSKAFRDKLLASLDSQLGPRIRHIAVHEFMSIKDLHHVTGACPDLRTVDFTGVMEPIDWSRYKRYFCGCRHGKYARPKEDVPKAEQKPFEDIYGPDEFKKETDKKLQPYLREQAKCYACRDRFQWPLVLKSCPDLFANLTSIRIMYEGHTKYQLRGSKPGRRHLPYLLKSAPCLQTLALECWRDVEEKFPDGIMSWYECHPKECRRFQNAIVENATQELRVLELNGIIELVPNLYKFVRSLEKLPKLRTVRVALHHDLKRRAAQTWLVKSRRADEADSGVGSESEEPAEDDDTDLLINYIRDLRRATDKGFNIEAINISDGYNIAKPWRYFSLLEPQSISHLRWLLRSDLDWNPTWKWKSYMYRDRLRVWWRPPRHDPDIITDSFQLRYLFKELRDAGKPVRIRLTTPGDEDSFFAWQTNHVYPTHGLGHYDVLPWRLDTVGDLVDEIELFWRNGLPFRAYRNRLDVLVGNITPEAAADAIRTCLLSTRTPLQKRLQFEREHMAPFFRRLKQWCPHLRKLALYMPAPFYPDTDRTFIERVLPGEGTGGWTVKTHGALPEYSGYTKDLVTEEENDMWGQESDSDDDHEYWTNKAMNKRRKISRDQVFDMLRKCERERCPMVERLFERRLDELGRPVKRLPGIDEEWNVTKRGLGLRGFDITDVKVKRDFRYLWPA